MVCGILVPLPGIRPVPPALEVQILDLWTAWEVPHRQFLLPAFFLMGYGLYFPVSLHVL